MKRVALLSGALLALTSLSFAQQTVTTPESADVVLKTATAKATKEKKHVLVIFTASWCGWCKRLEAFLAQPDIKPIVEKRLVITHLDVLESGDKKALENPGGQALMAKYGAEQAGIPFMLLYSGKGEKIGDSFFEDKGKKQNTGYPAAPEEIAAFVKILKAAKFSAEETATIESKLKEAAKKLGH